MSSAAACTACQCKEYQKHKWKKSDQCILCKHSAAQHGITTASNNSNDDEKVSKSTQITKTKQVRRKTTDIGTTEKISFANKKEAIGELTEYMQECKIETSGFTTIEEGMSHKTYSVCLPVLL